MGLKSPLFCVASFTTIINNTLNYIKNKNKKLSFLGGAVGVIRTIFYER